MTLSPIVSFFPAKYRQKKYAIPLAAVILVLLLLIILSASNTESVATTDVHQGEFFISIKSSGEIRAANSFTLTTPRLRYGQMQIVYLIPEGTTVKPGDVIVRFGTTDVDKLISDKQSELSINQSDLDKFKADRDLRLAELDGNLRNAELSFDQAKLQVDKMKFEAERREDRPDAVDEDSRHADPDALAEVHNFFSDPVLPCCAATAAGSCKAILSPA